MFAGPCGSLATQSVLSVAGQQSARAAFGLRTQEWMVREETSRSRSMWPVFINPHSSLPSLPNHNPAILGGRRWFISCPGSVSIIDPQSEESWLTPGYTDSLTVSWTHSANQHHSKRSHAEESRMINIYLLEFVRRQARVQECCIYLITREILLYIQCKKQTLPEVSVKGGDRHWRWLWSWAKHTRYWVARVKTLSYY